jgi:hypothetical protein
MRPSTRTILLMREPVLRWLVRGLAVASIPVLLSTCKLGDLFEAGTVGRLAVPDDSAAVASAAVGSTAPRILTLEITNETGGALPWTASGMLGSPWLSLSPTSGTTPDTVSVSLDPAGLTVGTYQDDIVVVATSGIDSVAIPVEFTIRPCDELSIDFDVPVSDSLTTEDCATPYAADRFGKLYGFIGEEGDSVSVVMTSGAFDAYLALDTISAPEGAAVTGESVGPVTPFIEADDCLGTEGDPCLRYVVLRPASPRSNSSGRIARR